jgi:hypothetical protein
MLSRACTLFLLTAEELGSKKRTSVEAPCGECSLKVDEDHSFTSHLETKYRVVQE